MEVEVFLIRIIGGFIISMDYCLSLLAAAFEARIRNPANKQLKDPIWWQILRALMFNKWNSASFWYCWRSIKNKSLFALPFRKNRSCHRSDMRSCVSNSAESCSCHFSHRVQFLFSSFPDPHFPGAISLRMRKKSNNHLSLFHRSNPVAELCSVTTWVCS